MPPRPPSSSQLGELGDRVAAALEREITDCTRIIDDGRTHAMTVIASVTVGRAVDDNEPDPSNTNPSPTNPGPYPTAPDSVGPDTPTVDPDPCHHPTRPDADTDAHAAGPNSAPTDVVSVTVTVQPADGPVHAPDQRFVVARVTDELRQPLARLDLVGAQHLHLPLDQ